MQQIVFAGVGNVLKQDDGIGVYICQHIKPTAYHHPLAVEVSIENYIGKILSLLPDILIILDAVDFGREAGYSQLIRVSELMDTTTNTHNISLRQLETLFPVPVYVWGIQPANLGFGEGFSPAVKEAARKVIQEIRTGNIRLINQETQQKQEAL